ncbi:hypothetical protein [Azospirillum isscasi]|uniref:Uncharacterized protein n=1 Tax=Azospirillum isscasi TaxID=3053926 RepID=A0ABU0WIE4_9PROT|nr:hypothetical protein [Azospirillum isscasi]MDQ2103995.1 hypothetical protein [Azospirillum isscasi]
MSGIFSVLSGGQSSMFQLQQAKKDWERAMDAMDYKDASQRLTDKADRAQQPFVLSPEQQKNHTAAVSALEEAKRVGGPKAVAAQRLEEVERKIAELKMMMRHNHGDREKLVQLAREAAILAKQAGRAAKEYGAGVAAAAEMGLPGGAGAPSAGGITIERTITRTSVTIVQTEIAVDVTMTIRGDDASTDGQSTGGAPPDASAAPPPPPLPTDGTTAQSAAAETMASDMAEGEEAAEDGEAVSAEAAAAEAAGLAGQAAAKGVGAGGQESADGTTATGKTATGKTATGKTDDEEDEEKAEEKATDGEGTGLDQLMEEAAPSLNAATSAPNGDRIRNFIQRMMADNELKMSRYREADEFGRRVETVLATVKSVIAEAKAANELDQAEERRKARRDSFKAYDKVVEEAQDNVNELRQAAFGSSVTLKDFVEATSGTDDTDSGFADLEGVDASAGNATDTAPADSASAQIGAQIGAQVGAQAGADMGMPSLSGSVNLFA